MKKKQKRKGSFVKHLIFWIIIILFAYFVFSGGLMNTYDNIKNRLSSSAAESQYGNNPDITKLVQKDGCYTIERITKYGRGMVKESVCKNQLCLLENLYYHSYTCEGRDLICYCSNS